MSGISTAAVKVAPSAASSLALSCTGTSFGSWVEFIAATAQITQLVAVANGASTFASRWIEIEFGIGAASSEVAIGSLFVFGANSGNIAPNILPMRRPINLVPQGTRVAIRIRSDSTISTFSLSLLYQELSDSEDMATGLLAAVPGGGTTGVSITPNATAWADSSWVELTSGLSEDIDAAGIAISLPTANSEYELDLGTGAAAAETVITTLRSAYRNSQSGVSCLWLPAPYPIAAGTRIAARLRKSDGGTTARLVSLLYYTGAEVVTDPGGGGGVDPGTDPTPGISLCGAAVPLAWWEITPAGSATTYRYAKVPINIDDEPKEPRVDTLGVITRALSTRAGEFRASASAPVLIDTDRVLRALEASDSLVGARAAAFVSTEAAIRANLASPGSAPPRRVFDGVVTDTEPLSTLLFQLQVTDYFGTLLDEFAAKRTFPQRVFTTTDFPTLGNSEDDATSPGNPGLIGKPIPIAYGVVDSPAHYVGKRTVNGFVWDEYVVFGHAPAPGGVVSIQGDVDGTRQTFLESQEGVDVLLPGHAAWAAHTGSSNTYVDYNGRRYFLFYARGPRSDSARLKKVPFIVRAGGVEDVGDGTGDMIDGLYTQILHLLINFVFGDYQSGAWLDAPQVPVELFSRIKTSAFDDLQTLSETMLAGGFLGVFMLGWDGRTHTLPQLLEEAAVNGGFRWGSNADGQLVPVLRDPTLATNRAIVDITDTIAQSFRARRRRDEIANTIKYRYARTYVQPLTRTTPAEGDRLPASSTLGSTEWGVEATPLVGTTVAKYGERILDLPLSMVADADTADTLAAYALACYDQPPVAASFREGLCGTDSDLGDKDTLTHFEGIDATGWTAREVQCEKHALDLDRFTVDKDYVDVGDLVLPS